jgi:hypothetical protein
MTQKKEYSDIETQEICNGSLQSAITCAKKGKPPCESCELMEECKKSKKALDELWKAKDCQNAP